MLWTLLQIVLVLFAVVKYVIPDGPPPIFGIYRRANAWYPLKFSLAYLVLSLRKYLNGKRAETASPTDPGLGVRSRSTIAEMDCVQPFPPNAPEAVDAVYFVAANRAGYYFVAATARRPNRVINGFWYLRIPGVGLLKAPKLPDTTLRSDGDAVFNTTDGLSIEPVQPMKRWRITYDGLMKFEGAEEKQTRVRIDLEWKSDLPYFDFDINIPPEAMARALAKEPWSRDYFKRLKESHQTHHEQMGILTGTAKVDGYGKYNLQMNSMRDHSYANTRDWKLMHRYGLHSVTVEDGTKFCVGIISHPDIFSSFEMGYLYTPCGELHGVQRCDLPLHCHGEGGTPPTDYSFTFKAGGRDYLVECKVIESPELFIGNEWEARLIERMCKYRVNGREGWGFAEWEYRYRDGRPPAYGQ